MSTNTTTDGFRVGRRVRVTNCDNRWDAHEARIVGKGERQDVWYAIPEGADGNRLFYEWEMELLPEPDAPDTPKPRFKRGDRVRRTTSDLPGSIAGIRGIDTNGIVTWDVNWDDGIKACALEYNLVPLDATPEPPANDPINPRHYTSHPSGIECIEVTRHMSFNLGNAMKYVWRADLNGNSIQDLRKAAWYINDEIEKRQKSTTSPSN